MANAEFQATAEQYRLLARKSVNQADLQRYVKKVLKVKEDGKDAGTRMNNIIEEIVGLAEAGRGNDLPSIRGTYWAAYNGVTEWLAYGRGSKPQNRLEQPVVRRQRRHEPPGSGNGPGNGGLILTRGWHGRWPWFFSEFP